MNKRNLFYITYSLLVFCVLLFLAIPSCRNVPSDPGRPHPNKRPDTRLSNLPVNDSTGQYIREGRIPEKTLQWIGDDEDGFIIAYRVRWTDSTQIGINTTLWTTILNITSLGEERLDTLILVQGSPASIFGIYNFFATFDPEPRAKAERDRIRDSLATGRPFAVPYHSGVVPGDSVVGASPLNFEAPTKGSFIFASPGPRNKHKFEVKAIDNNNVEDPSPAYTYFWTLPSDTPIVTISIAPTTLSYVLRYPTEKNPGLNFAFGAIDPSTSDIVFSWAVDTLLAPETTLRWSPWSPEPTAVVTALDLRLTQTPRDTHMFHVRARNRWGVVSRIVSLIFLARVPPIDDPSWPRKTLIINDNRVSGSGSVDSNLTRAFYSDIMNSLMRDPLTDTLITAYRIWTVITGANTSSFPPIDTLVHYTHVLLLVEQPLPLIGPEVNQRRIETNRQGILRRYLNVGGNLIYSGTPNIKSAILPYNAWASEIFHVQPPPNENIFPLQNTQPDFVRAIGIEGYQDIRFDTTRFPDSVGIRSIAVNYPIGFGRAISLFDSKRDSVGFENAPLGVRYLGVAIPPARKTFSVVHFAFPLYYALRDDVFLALRKAYVDIQSGD